jgi:hypothetical protein
MPHTDVIACDNADRIPLDFEATGFGPTGGFGPVSVMLSRRRHMIVPLRWPGSNRHNVVALYSSLAGASDAARRLEVAPGIVSALLIAPRDPRLLSSVAVGVHTADVAEAEAATASLRASGALFVTMYAGAHSEVAAAV